LENELKPFDIIPIVPIIKGSGGIITNWEGHEKYDDGNIVASSNHYIHDKILDLIDKL
jgi:myo-inositol-1(or 4)-monophosphatase